MAKSVRSKIKKYNRTQMRKVVGEPIRQAQIEETNKKLTEKLQSHGT